MKTIGERLEWALTLRDKSIREVQLQLQERSVKGSSYASFHGYVKGGQVPPLELLEAVAGLLEVRPAWLAFGEGEPLEIAEQVASKARAAERQPGGSQGLVLRHPFQDVQDRIPLPPRAIKEDIDRVVSWYVYAIEMDKAEVPDGLTAHGAIAAALAAPLEALGIKLDRVGKTDLIEYIVATAISLQRVLRSLTPPIQAHGLDSGGE